MTNLEPAQTPALSPRPLMTQLGLAVWLWTPQVQSLPEDRGEGTEVKRQGERTGVRGQG